jgi:SulP family sulfate permease
LAPERIFLEEAGEAILVMELQGALFFGTGETLLSAVEAELRRNTSCVILDLRRLTDIDSTGANALLELKTTLAQQGEEFLLALTDGTAAMERLEHFGVLSAIGEANILPEHRSCH